MAPPKALSARRMKKPTAPSPFSTVPIPRLRASTPKEAPQSTGTEDRNFGCPAAASLKASTQRKAMRYGMFFSNLPKKEQPNIPPITEEKDSPDGMAMAKAAPKGDNPPKMRTLERSRVKTPVPA